MAEDPLIRVIEEREAALAELERRTAWSNAEIAERDQALEEAIAERATLEAEVTQLRERVSSLTFALGEGAGWFDRFSAERAAHEATKLELDSALDGMANETTARVAAEARVTELERVVWEWADANAKLGAAIDRARGLLERVDEALENEGPWLALQTQLRAWLRAHPATATPAVTFTRHTCSVTSDEECPVCTPGATGAERCDLCGMKTPHDAERPLHHIGCGVGAPEKGQGT